MEEKRGELTSGHPEQRQQKQSPWNRKDCDEDNEMDTRQNNEIPAQTPDELEGVDNLRSSGVQESSQKEFALEQLKEKAVAQQQNMRGARERDQRAQMYQSLYCKNPTLLSLCRTLFPEPEFRVEWTWFIGSARFHPHSY
ncbi:hypothetical protein SAY86_025087 [Trapa natans]|uniref:Uncharacterized protein n=1 Tax=Trapa natans TaxID=22666 RepID=A0AAN7M7Q3_TRANT|nr:hypothetical protein SAY86_025087 [Trapa natans]